MNSNVHRRHTGFTLVEVLVGIGVFSIICLGSAAAIGSITKMQRDALDRTKACALAAMIGQWRGMHMATLAYTYYAQQFIPAPAAGIVIPSAKTIGTGGGQVNPDTAWMGSASATPWMDVCPLLQSKSPVPFPTFAKYPAPTPDVLTNPYYIVNLTATGFTTASAEFPTSAQLQPYRDMLITFTPPSTSWTISGQAVHSKWAVMTIWASPREHIDGSYIPQTYVKTPARFLGHFLIPDSFCP